MSSIFAALVSGHIVSNRILMEYALHTDTGGGAPSRRPPNPMSSIFAALVSGRFVSNRILIEYALHTDTGGGAPSPRPPNPMSSIFAALVSGRFVSNRILMEYALHTDTGGGAPSPRRTDFEATESYNQRICCTDQCPPRFHSDTDGVCIACGYWSRRTDSVAHRFRGAPIPRPPSLMSSIFAALTSVRFVSNRI